MKTQENKAPQKAQDDVKTVAFFFLLRLFFLDFCA